ncbi:DeoR family transcriptional regulator [Streptomyces sp. MP131-18]|uniref:DeoR family transcriptional regulator n=1 Tax=Streptomyces sp. MP131-18 TaxID=1857892 RepID=UPI0009D5E8F8|nr:DeoR family transcriptional regulator [Streptomyces sp. MP131-18]ONK16089.1 DNA-binding transcriptional regulator AgaR [Streptomyces sp. MP131-18]
MVDTEGVPAEERRQRIAAAVEDRGFVHVGNLAEAFGISRVTVRADLDSLEKRGRLRRVRGGALAAHRAGGMPDGGRIVAGPVTVEIDAPLSRLPWFRRLGAAAPASDG